MIRAFLTFCLFAAAAVAALELSGIIAMPATLAVAIIAVLLAWPATLALITLRALCREDDHDGDHE